MVIFRDSGTNINIIKAIKKLAPFLCLLILLFSCNHPQKGLLSSDGYTKVLDSANYLYDKGKQAEAMRYLDSETVKYKEPAFLQRFYYLDYHYNFFYHAKNDKAKAMLYADSMLALFDSPETKLKYNNYYGQAIFFKGDILFDENRFEEAYQYYYLGKIIASKSLDNCTLSDYSYRMGMIMYKQEHYHLAAAYFKKSSEETNSCVLDFRSFYRRQELLNNTGLSYSKINMKDSAMIYYHKTLDYINTAGKQFPQNSLLINAARGVVYGDEANEYIKSNQLKQAKALLKKSISINLTKGYDNHDAELTELKLAHIYEQENKPDSVITLLNNLRNQLDSVANGVAEADWNLMMANYFNKLGKSNIAYNYLLRYDALKDSINNSDKQLKQADVTEQMERLRKNYELENLKKNNSIQHIYLNVAFVFGLMLLLIISLIFLNWQKSKKNIKTLGSLNNQVNDQNVNLEQALLKLKQSSQEKDRILRTVAHDLRNPLGGVASLTSLMAEESEYSDEQKELIILIKETSNNSLELINEILDATDNTAVKINKEKELVEINSLLNHCVELLHFKAAEKHQEIVLELLDTPIELFISREKIWRVISNLISNALKFSSEHKSILVKLEDEGENVKISVKDNGIGIPDELQSKVFNMFTDAKRPGTAGEKSFGLGLSICQQIIENHNGKIWFESTLNKGTTFYITLNKP